MAKELTSHEYLQLLKESGPILSTPGVPMDKYSTMVDPIISKPSSTDGLSDIIGMITKGFGGEGKAGNTPTQEPTKPVDKGEGEDGADVPAPELEVQKGEGKAGDTPEFKAEDELELNTGAENTPADVSTPLKLKEVFNEDEAEILSRLIQEMEKIQETSFNENALEEFEDTDS